jgi:type IV pilus assembly protein PilV
MKTNNKRDAPQAGNERGFTMLEILITLFMLTLWMLASAGVQSASLQFNKAAQFRTQAVYFATDIAERMQANKAGATAGNYAWSGSSTDTPPSCTSSTCSPDQLAAFDLGEWDARVKAALPSAQTNVQPLAIGNPVTYTIVISWVDRRNDRTYSSSGSDETYSYTATKTVFDSSNAGL